MVKCWSILETEKSFMVICPNSIGSNTGIDLKWPDNLSKMAAVDAQDLHLHGGRWRLTDDSILSVTLPMEPIEEIVSKVLKHWWHLKLVMYLSFRVACRAGRPAGQRLRAEYYYQPAGFAGRVFLLRALGPH